jgi:hypothetical protein
VKLRFNFRLVFLLLLLGAFAIREVALELRPSWLRPGLHLFAYVGNTADGTVSAIDLIKPGDGRHHFGWPGSQRLATTSDTS